MLRIIALHFFETGSYHDMTIRPYQTHIDPISIAQFNEVTANGTQLKSSAIAPVAGQIVRPRAESMGVAKIDEGWDYRRWRFMMAVERPGYAGATTMQYLTGYTDPVDHSYGNRTNPHMRLYFNSSITTRKVLHQTNYGSQYMTQVEDASQILLGGYKPAFNGFDQSMPEVQATIRPFDVFASLQTSHSDPSGLAITHDLRSSFAEGIKKSTYKNNSAPIYLSNMMNVLNDAYARADDASDISGVYGHAVELQRKDTVTSDPFLSLAMRQTSLMEGGSMTYHELCQMSPGVDNIANFHYHDAVSLANSHTRMSSEHWAGSTNETVMATILSQSIPAVMMDLMLTQVHIEATNRTYDSSLELRVTGAKSFAEGVDLTPYLQLLISRLKVEVFQTLTLNNQIDFFADISVNLIADTHINISVSGGPLTPYCVPSFCDGAFSPMLTNDMNSLRYLAADIESLNSNLGYVALKPQASFADVFMGDQQYTPQQGGTQMGFNNQPQPAVYGGQYDSLI